MTVKSIKLLTLGGSGISTDANRNVVENWTATYQICLDNADCFCIDARKLIEDAIASTVGPFSFPPLGSVYPPPLPGDCETSNNSIAIADSISPPVWTKVDGCCCADVTVTYNGSQPENPDPFDACPTIEQYVVEEIEAAETATFLGIYQAENLPDCKGCQTCDDCVPCNDPGCCVPCNDANCDPNCQPGDVGCTPCEPAGCDPNCDPANACQPPGCDPTCDPADACPQLEDLRTPCLEKLIGDCGAPINAAGQPFDPPLERTRSLKGYRIIVPMESYNSAQYDCYENSVNCENVVIEIPCRNFTLTIPKYRGYLRPVTGNLETVVYVDPVTNQRLVKQYWRVVFDILTDPKGFCRDHLNKGTARSFCGAECDPACDPNMDPDCQPCQPDGHGGLVTSADRYPGEPAVMPITSNGYTIEEPTLLNGNGLPLGPGEKPHYLRYCPDKQTDWNDPTLGLTF